MYEKIAKTWLSMQEMVLFFQNLDEDKKVDVKLIWKKVMIKWKSSIM